MKLVRYLQIGKDSEGKVTPFWNGWSNWSEAPDAIEINEYTKLHREWQDPDDIARRYHPEWKQTRWIHQFVKAELVVPFEMVIDPESLEITGGSMADDYSNLCVTPQDPIAKPPAGPKYSTSAGQFNGEKGYPSRNSSTIDEKTYDKAFGGVPTDETRGTSA